MVDKHYSYLRRMARLILKPARLAIYIEAFFWLIIATLVRWFFPFNRAIRLMGLHVVSEESMALVPTDINALTSSRYWREIGYAYDTAASLLSPTHPCLISAYAARFHLGIRRKSFVLCMGVTPGKIEPMEAHAWLIVDNTIVTGFKGWKDEFVRVAGFSP